MKRLMFILWLGCLLAPWGCRTVQQPIPGLSHFKDSEARKVVERSLRHQGYMNWAAEGVAIFELRSSETQEDGEAVYTERFTCDLKNQRLISQSSQDGAFRKRAFMEGRFSQFLDEQNTSDPSALAAGRERFLQDYYLTLLPFKILDYGPFLIYAGTENQTGLTYQVVQLDLGEKESVFPWSWCRLYYSSATRCLEKVLLKVELPPMETRYIWCEYDNFFDPEGVLLPHQRELTLANDSEGGKTGKPFLRQWMHDLRLKGSVDPTLFNLP